MLIPEKLNVLNIGVELFANELRGQGVSVTTLEWTPPAEQNQADALAMIETMFDDETAPEHS